VAALEERTPHYVRIYRHLKRQIEANQLMPGTRLPAQRELSRTFNVTLMTLRQAVQRLEQEGLVVTQHGRGTYVADRPVSYQLATLRSLAQEMAVQGHELVTTVLRRSPDVAPQHVADALQDDPEAHVLVLERVRLVEAKAVVYQRSYMPLWLGEALADVDLSEGSLYDCLDQHLGVDVVRADETIRAVALAKDEASVLGVGEGTPAILSERVTFTVDDRPIIYDEAFMRGDRIVICAARFRSDLSVGYRLRPGEMIMR
jgi:DNA-binding GntR family transcriptional regulator